MWLREIWKKKYPGTGLNNGQIEDLLQDVFDDVPSLLIPNVKHVGKRASKVEDSAAFHALADAKGYLPRDKQSVDELLNGPEGEWDFWFQLEKTYKTWDEEDGETIYHVLKAWYDQIDWPAPPGS